MEEKIKLEFEEDFLKKIRQCKTKKEVYDIVENEKEEKKGIWLLNIPEEMLKLIFSFIEQKSFKNFACTCRKLRDFYYRQRLHFSGEMETDLYLKNTIKTLLIPKSRNVVSAHLKIEIGVIKIDIEQMIQQFPNLEALELEVISLEDPEAGHWAPNQLKFGIHQAIFGNKFIKSLKFTDFNFTFYDYFDYKTIFATILNENKILKKLEMKLPCSYRESYEESMFYFLRNCCHQYEKISITIEFYTIIEEKEFISKTEGKIGVEMTINENNCYIIHLFYPHIKN